MKLALAALLVVVSAAGSARADAVKAELVCGAMTDGKITAPVPAKDAPRLTGRVGCTLQLTAPATRGDYIGVVHTVRYVVDAKGATAKKAMTGATGRLSHDKLEVVWDAGAKDPNGEVPFASCEAFDIVASLSDRDGKPVFDKTLHVDQTCPKPAAMAIDVSCAAEAVPAGGENGNDTPTSVLKLPTKNKASLAGYAQIHCAVTSTDKRFGGKGFAVSASSRWSRDGKSGTRSGGPFTGTQMTSDAFDIYLPNKTAFESCSPKTTITVEATIDGAPAATRAIDVAQDCRIDN